MMLVITSDYIIDVFRHYLADSKFSKSEWLKPNDVVIVNTGFRECLLELLEEISLVHEMAKFLTKKLQFSIEDANKMRLVTKVR